MGLTRNIAASEGGMLTYSRSKGGRPRVGEAKITDAFGKASHPTRARGPQTARETLAAPSTHLGPPSPAPRIPGPPSPAGRACPLASAHRRIPRPIRAATRNTCLCGQREALLEVRTEGLRLLRGVKGKERGRPAGEYPESAPPSGVGQHAYEKIGRLLIDALRNALGEGYPGETTDAEAADLIRMSDTSEFHARVASMKRNAY